MLSSNIETLGHSTKAGRVYAAVKRLIITGELRPGDPINQGQLAGALGVSTTPVREAMRSLEKEGWVIDNGHGDLAVRTIEPGEMAEVYGVKTLLELEAVRLAASRRTDDDIEIMRAALAATHHEHESEAERFQATRQAHRAIYAASHHEVLIELLDNLWDRYERHQMVIKELLESHAVQDEHEPVVEAVVAGEPDRAVDLLSRHLARASTKIQNRADSAAATVSDP